MKAAIVGCGAIAKMHASVLKEMPGVEIVGFADCKEERAQAYREEYGSEKTNMYASLEEMLEKEQVDVLHICTPHYLHTPMAVYALEKGIHVFTEKPPAISRDQFAELKAAAKKNHARLGICFQNRYNESTKAMEELLASEKSGKIKGARAFVSWMRTKEYYTESDWRGKWETEGGGCLINQSVHTLDLLNLFMGGQPVETQAHMMNYHLKDVIEVEDTVSAYIRYPDAAASFYATTAYEGNRPIMIDVECENVSLRLEGSYVTCIYRDGRKEELTFYNGHTIGKDYWGTGHKACIRDFYHCLETGEKFSIEVEDVESTFQLMMDIYQSAKEQRPVAAKENRRNENAGIQ